VTPTEAEICRASKELFGVAEADARRALASEGRGPQSLLDHGLLNAEQVDEVLEVAYQRVREASEQAEGRARPRSAAPGATPPPPPPRRRAHPELAALVARLREVVDSGGVGLRRVQLAASPGASPGAPPAQAPARAPRRAPPEPRPPTVDGDLSAEPPSGPTVQPAARRPGGQTQARRLLEEAAAVSFLVREGLDPRAMGREGDLAARLFRAGVDADVVDDLLLPGGQLMCSTCDARYELGAGLVPYGEGEACPRCGTELARPGSGRTVAIPAPDARPASVTGAPAYARPPSATGMPGYARPGSATGLPDYAPPATKTDSGLGRIVQEGGTWSNYEVLGELARGGMGIVYKARQKGLGRDVCLKVMRGASMASSDERRRFLREAEAAAKLHHPGIVPIHDVGEHEGKCFFSMDFVEGQELGHYVKNERPQARQIVEILVLVCDAIHYAHQRGIIHRDLKPANVMVDLDKKPHVMDFGIAKRLDVADDDERGPMTQEGEIMGTPHYMAPEQAEGRVSEIDVRSDVYSLGVILYELLTGRRPFQDDNILRLIKMVVNEDPKSLRLVVPDLDEDLETIVLKTMEKEKERRYQTALALKEELQRWLNGEAILARRATWDYRVRKWAARNRGVAISYAVGAVGILTVLGLWIGSLVAELVRVRQEVAHLSTEAQADLRAERYQEAFTAYGRALFLDPDAEAVQLGRVEAALRLADQAIEAKNPGQAESVLQQVEYLLVRADEVGAALRRAAVERERQIEVGVARQQRFLEATRNTLAALEALEPGASLSGAEEQGHVFDLVRHRDAETVKLLREVVAGDGDLRVRRVATRALGWMRDPRAVPELAGLLRDPGCPPELALTAAEALGWIGGEGAWSALLAARSSRDARFRARTQAALERIATGLEETPSEGEESDDPAEREAAALRRRLLTADRLRLAGRLEGALEAYDWALSRAPDAVEGYLGRAQVHLALGNLEQAEEDLDRVVPTGGPSFAPALISRAEVRRRRGDPAGALKDLEAVLRVDPDRVEANLATARILLAQGELGPAAEAVEAALAVREGDPEALGTRAEVRLAQGDAAAARADAEAAVAAAPHDAGLRLVLGRAWLSEGEAEAAEAAAAEALGLEPSEPRAYRLAAQAAVAQGATQRALDHLEQGAARTGLAGLRVARAQVLVGAGRADDAEADLTALLAEEGLPDGARLDALSLRGVARIRAGRPAEALPDLRRVVAGAPRSAAARYNLACALAQVGERAEAVAALGEAIARGHPKGPGLRRDPDLEPLHGDPAFEALAEGDR
jgi:tetratricopeptide (TPR) repeat protein/tRNA A-37 threonylcarbamoyl transferase component Bud32